MVAAFHRLRQRPQLHPSAVLVLLVIALSIINTRADFGAGGSFATYNRHSARSVRSNSMNAGNQPRSNTTTDDDIPGFVFIKTHKTGSSSVTVMLAQALERRGLKPAVPCYDHLGYPREFDDPAHTLCGRDPLHFKAAISHIRWTETSRTTLLKLMAPDRPKIFTIVRDPITRFISALGYYNNKKLQQQLHFDRNDIREAWLREATHRIALSEVRDDVAKYARQLHFIGYAFDFGLANDYEPRESANFRQRAKEFVDSLDFVLLYEEWDLSMALLKRDLNMTYKDVVYPHLKKVGKGPVVVSQATRDLFCQVLWTDCILYDLIQQRFWAAVDDDLRRSAKVVTEVNEAARLEDQTGGRGKMDVQDYFNRLRKTT
ncbi:hypothetical protein PTSG_09284 [Salpingoeca rosetta]|uniref:Sulfotransferase domain-containing protein n=1 Tax=Salpingoeca rosetta (strain ATCC 50818 / BSB-021) TaxID=946362 RepID=F2UN93_SALR5|nr:uncharacterized protein PTSG_09284 [Salpingoeca rosetta]EGD78592.1 hypothetical protein PTSG_09284 [Salpingoeca rosetta]|eukprot:XP_004989541.1 hypothetical protein PTSG_09284 [Salpingoeca rosetta]